MAPKRKNSSSKRSSKSHNKERSAEETAEGTGSDVEMVEASTAENTGETIESASSVKGTENSNLEGEVVEISDGTADGRDGRSRSAKRPRRGAGTKVTVTASDAVIAADIPPETETRRSARSMSATTAAAVKKAVEMDEANEVSDDMEEVEVWSRGKRWDGTPKSGGKQAGQSGKGKKAKTWDWSLEGAMTKMDGGLAKAVSSPADMSDQINAIGRKLLHINTFNMLPESDRKELSDLLLDLESPLSNPKPADQVSQVEALPQVDVTVVGQAGSSDVREQTSGSASGHAVDEKDEHIETSLDAIMAG
ncbi:hypothetical protein HDU93_006611, partial [Gonapodya sp. JEL0774]